MTQVHQQRPESPTVTLTWVGMRINTRYIKSTRGTSSGDSGLCFCTCVTHFVINDCMLCRENNKQTICESRKTINVTGLISSSFVRVIMHQQPSPGTQITWGLENWRLSPLNTHTHTHTHTHTRRQTRRQTHTLGSEEYLWRIFSSFL